MIPATPLHPAHQPNQAAWEKLATWNKPTVVLIAESMAQQGFKPQEFYDHLPGTEGQAHHLYPDAGFFLIEDWPEQLAEKTIEFIQANPLEAGLETTPPRTEAIVRWSLQTPTGETVSFPRGDGKPTVLFFWASWCPYCKALMPYLQTIADEFNDTVDGGLPVYAINFRDDGDPQAYMEANKFSYTLLLEGGDVAEAYGIYGTPGVLIFDGNDRQVFNLYDLADRYEQEVGTPKDLKHSQKAARKAPWWAERIREALKAL
jgi:thiol-disulfide isomerase/thioredoxin